MISGSPSSDDMATSLPAVSTSTTSGSGSPCTGAFVPSVGSCRTPGSSMTTDSTASSSCAEIAHPAPTQTTTAMASEPTSSRRSTAHILPSPRPGRSVDARATTDAGSFAGGRTIRRRWSRVSPGVVDALPRTGKCAARASGQATWMPTSSPDSLSSTRRPSKTRPPPMRDLADATVLVDDLDRTGVLRWTAAWTLVEDELTVLDQFATPDTPRLGALEGPFEALGAQGTARTDGFCSGDVEELVAEEEMGEGAGAVAAASGGPRRDGGGEFVGGRFEDCVHDDVRLSGSGVRCDGAGGWGGKRRRPPGFGSRRPREVSDVVATSVAQRAVGENAWWRSERYGRRQWRVLMHPSTGCRRPHDPCRGCATHTSAPRRPCRPSWWRTSCGSLGVLLRVVRSIGRPPSRRAARRTPKANHAPPHHVNRLFVIPSISRPTRSYGRGTHGWCGSDNASDSSARSSATDERVGDGAAPADRSGRAPRTSGSSR